MRPWRYILSLWGVDIPLTALSWGVAIAALFQITMLTAGPLLLLTAMVWVVVLFTRVGRGIFPSDAPYAGYYRSRAFPMALMGLASLLASLWMLFFYVGQYLIYFSIVPVILLLLAHLPLLRQSIVFRLFFSAAAFVFACAAPAYFYSFFLSPADMLFNSQLWCLVCLFLLFMLERRGMGKTGKLSSQVLSVIVTAGLFALFLLCCYQACAVSYERGFYVTIAMGAACCHGLRRLRPHLSEDAWYALGWPFMAFPALLGVLLYAPEAWC